MDHVAALQLFQLLCEYQAKHGDDCPPMDRWTVSDLAWDLYTSADDRDRPYMDKCGNRGLVMIASRV